jgi:hypothetical protein
MAYVDWPTSFTGGVRFDGWIADESGRAGEIIHDERMDPITNIPTGAIGIEERLYVFYMAMKFWGTKENPCWRSHFAGLAYSDDLGETFEIVEDFQFPEGSNFGMVAAAAGSEDPDLGEDGGYVYVWGTESNRCSGVKLARVRAEALADREAWRYFGGTVGGKPLWFMNESSGREIVPAVVGEMSVMYNRWAGCWTMMYLTFHPGENPASHPGHIVLSQAPAPWGPWSEPLVVLENKDAPGGLYGSYMHPRFVEEDGRVVYFTVSVWDPYDVYWWRVRFRGEEDSEEGPNESSPAEARPVK